PGSPCVRSTGARVLPHGQQTGAETGRTLAWTNLRRGNRERASQFIGLPENGGDPSGGGSPGRGERPCSSSSPELPTYAPCTSVVPARATGFCLPSALLRSSR